MNIRTPLFHLSIWRDGWVFFAILPDYKASGPGSRNSPLAWWAVERIPANDDGSAFWVRMS
jgi:hypothetical protein